MACELKNQLSSAIKDAMRSKDKPRLAVLRTLMSEFKRIEVDERIELDNARALAVLDKQLKQRKDSLAQYQQANRQDLAEIEAFEIQVIQNFLPTPLSDAEIDQLVGQAIADSGAASMQDMGKVMAIVKAQAQGRADMGAISKTVKQQLA